MTADETVPEDVQEAAERLTRRAREAVDEREATAYREDREELLAEYGYTARVREEDRAVLVLHPAEWVEGDTVRPDRIDDVDRGIEIPLEGPGEASEWEAVAEHNREIAEQVREEHGPDHGANAEALAEFCNNHYAKPIESLTEEERQEFLTDYYPRNVWPTDEQKAVVEESVGLAVDAASTGRPR
jgi:hypothetical protein